MSLDSFSLDYVNDEFLDNNDPPSTVQACERLLASLRERGTATNGSTKVDLCYHVRCPLKDLVELLEFNTIITFLNLNCNNNHVFSLKHHNAEELIPRLIRNNTTLREIRLSFNELGDQCAVGVAEALKVNKTLKILQFSGNQVGLAGAKALSDMFRVNSTLNSLWFERHPTSMSAAGYQYLLDGLKANVSVTSFPIDRDAGVGEAIREQLALNATIQQAIAWPTAHQLLLELCLIFLPENVFFPYLLLELFDRIEHMRFAPHNKKIALILSVQQSLKRVLAQRKAMKR